MKKDPYPRIAGVIYESVVDGEGVRAVIFLSGCSHHCPGCHNPMEQDPDYGKRLNNEDIVLLAQEIKKRPYLSGITLSGGDPMYNPEKTAAFLYALTFYLYGCTPVYEKELNIWMYTGYTWDDLVSMFDRDASAKYISTKIDVVVDGRFEKSLADKRLSFRGSSNQRIIDVGKSLKDGHVVLWQPENQSI